MFLAIFAGTAAFAATWVIAVFTLGYLSGHIQVVRLLVFVQPYKSITTLVVFGAAVWAAVIVFRTVA